MKNIWLSIVGIENRDISSVHRGQHRLNLIDHFAIAMKNDYYKRLCVDIFHQMKGTQHAHTAHNNIPLIL